MAKPATRMKSIVLKSYSESRTRRLVGSPPPDASGKRKDCAAISMHCEPLPVARTPAHGAPTLRDDLRATIENMVIPRLAIAQCLLPDAQRPEAQLKRGRVLPTLSEVDLLARIAAQPDLDGAFELSLEMLRAGLSLETLLLQLIGPAARRLGSDWEEDIRSFADVTVGLGTLHELMHMLARRDARDAIGSPASSHTPAGTILVHKSALLVPGPGEQHTLGLYIFAELLRHSRWTVTLETNIPNSGLLQLVRSQSLDMVGITVSSHERFAEVAKLIQRLRRASQNQAMRVVLGGPVDLTREAEREGATFYGDARRAIESFDGD